MIAKQQTGDASAEALLKMKKELEAKAGKVKQLEGRRDGLYDQLNREHGCKTFEEGETKFQEVKASREQKQTELDEGVQALTANYEWDFVK